MSVSDDAVGGKDGVDFASVVLERRTVARGGPGGSSISVTTDVLSARIRVFDHLESEFRIIAYLHGKRKKKYFQIIVQRF